ncbi:alpha/beta fold hydrolase [Amycolatopsis granulosa]|uniref:alpha/beta fold hydrolase n=1 Tax=Amycolatopsis granulosa TaxID=185684 RepID=UPI0014203BFB|nr:alpha/beta hydrolase [Amycolatopsis granulosa]NIH84869.1 3-oxoadipate enol-lactonase [Amycolatopsis granulosa]
MIDEDRDVPTSLGTLRVHLRGSGDPIVMWPSLLMDHTLWQAQAEHLSGRFTTVAVDPPGHGASSALRGTFTLDECAGVVIELLDALGFGRTHFLGNSWGAMVGATFAARHPDRVLTSTLMNGTASAAPRRQKAEFAALLAMAKLLRGIRPPLTRSVGKAFLGPTSLRTRPEVVARVIELARRNDVRSLTFAVTSVVSRRPDQRALLASIRTPVLVIGGREDATFPPRELEEMAAAIPGAELVFLEDAAHLAALEVPDVVNKLLDGFLTR